jgi:hypothetical protein
MSAPRTDIEKQKRWHWAPLAGMALAVVFGLGIIFIWLMDEAAGSGEPGAEPNVQTETTPAQTAPPAAAAPVY